MNLEQRANIKFCFKLGKTFTETFELMKKVYGDNCLSRARVHQWFKRFKEGREDIKDDDHPGQKSFVITQSNIEIVRKFIENEPNSSLRYMAMKLNLSRSSIRRILTEKLGLKYHFDDDQFDIDSSGSKGKLKSNALPTIFDGPIAIKKEDVSLKSAKGNKISSDFDDIEPEFVDVSQHSDNSFWRNDFDVDSLEQPLEEKGFQKSSHQENSYPIEVFNQKDSFENSNVSEEQLCVEPELPGDNIKHEKDCEDILKLDSVENISVQNVISKTKVLEQQLSERDEELKETKRLLSKTLEQVERLKALNDRFKTQISELLDKSKPKRVKRTKLNRM